MLTKEILCAYLPYRVKVQYQGIINTEELSEHKKKEPKGWDVPDGKYTEWLTTFPDEVIGTKYSDIKEVKFYKGYVRIHVGKKHGYLKPLHLDDFKLLLRPLSSIDLKWFQDNIDPDLEDFRINCEPENNHFSVEVCEKVLGWSAISYEEYQLFLKNHVDIFGLIESGHAIELKEVAGESKYTESKEE